MNSSLYISKSSMNGLQKNLDVVSNNISNVNTIGYKKQNSSFQELLINDVRSKDVPMSLKDGNIGINRGMKLTQNSLDMSSGSLVSTLQPTDLSIHGTGFFQVIDAKNQAYLTKDGAFHFDKNNSLKNDCGDVVSIQEYVPKVNWPKGNLRINQTGDILINQECVGKINLFTVDTPENLESIGSNKYKISENMQLKNDNASTVEHGFLENSNVDLSESMVDMITTQRAYSLNAKVLQSTDEIMQKINEFKQ